MKTFKGDLVKSVEKGVILQQVNCQGVMGSGIAKQIRQKYPVVWEDYDNECKSYSISLALLGTILPCAVKEDLTVINLFAQMYYGRDGKRYTSYDALDECLFKVAKRMKGVGLPLDLIHHPMLGCGLGGAHWSVVQPMIDLHFEGRSNLWIL